MAPALRMTSWFAIISILDLLYDSVARAGAGAIPVMPTLMPGEGSATEGGASSQAALLEA